ncbi:MAG: peroxiredoxin [Clostridia bacterium]|nr:peroxiredoxin [Clostridia bacterium]
MIFVPARQIPKQVVTLPARVITQQGRKTVRLNRVRIAPVTLSKDSAASHLKFAEKFSLPFIILSDPDLTAIKAYGVWQEKKLYGKTTFGVVRTTFIIDEDGVIERVMNKVKPDTNAEEILAALGGGEAAANTAEGGEPQL